MGSCCHQSYLTLLLTAALPRRCPASALQQLKELRRRLVAAERKLLFFLSWANEQPGELYELLALAAAGEHQKHAAAVGSQAAPASAAAAGLAAQLGSVSLNRAGAEVGQQAAQTRQAGTGVAPGPAVLIEEL